MRFSAPGQGLERGGAVWGVDHGVDGVAWELLHWTHEEEERSVAGSCGLGHLGLVGPAQLGQSKTLFFYPFLLLYFL